VLADDSNILTGSFSGLFKLIYNKVEIPDQWEITKTVPVYKNKCEKVRTLRTTDS
jgi:hypothetical protein